MPPAPASCGCGLQVGGPAAHLHAQRAARCTCFVERVEIWDNPSVHLQRMLVPFWRVLERRGTPQRRPVPRPSLTERQRLRGLLRGPPQDQAAPGGQRAL